MYKIKFCILNKCMNTPACIIVNLFMLRIQEYSGCHIISMCNRLTNKQQELVAINVLMLVIK